MPVVQPHGSEDGPSPQEAVSAIAHADQRTGSLVAALIAGQHALNPYVSRLSEQVAKGVDQLRPHERQRLELRTAQLVGPLVLHHALLGAALASRLASLTGTSTEQVLNDATQRLNDRAGGEA